MPRVRAKNACASCRDRSGQYLSRTTMKASSTWPHRRRRAEVCAGFDRRRSPSDRLRSISDCMCAGIAGRSLCSNDRGFEAAHAATESPNSGCVRDDGSRLLGHLPDDKGARVQDRLEAVDTANLPSFHVPFRSSMWIVSAGSLVYPIVALNMGLLISTTGK
jgi:hypothetical protein